MIGLFGGNGYVGQEFTKQLVNRELPFHEFHLNAFNYLDKDVLLKIFSEFQLSFVINCAGYVGKPNVDACEDNKDATFEGNVTFPNYLAEMCVLFNIPLGQISSGCLFQDYKLDSDLGWTEEDEVSSEGSYYTYTKKLCEANVPQIQKDSYLWRLRFPFNEVDGPRNYLTKIQTYKKLLDAENSLSHLGDFVSACLDLYENRAPYGKYNIVNSGSTSARAVAAKIKEILNLDKDFDFFENDEEFYTFGAKAPRSNCVLDNSKLIKVGGVNIRSVDEAIEDSLNKWIVQNETSNA